MAYTFSLTFKHIYRSIMASKLRTSVNEHLIMFEAVSAKAKQTQDSRDLTQVLLILDEIVDTLVSARDRLKHTLDPYITGEVR